MRLLIAEDDPKLLKTLAHIFESNNYSVDKVNNGKDAIDYAMTGEYDGLILDIMMPGADGLAVLRYLRAKGIKTPALFLTAKTETYQKIEGLDAGADDYLPKPFSTAELLARVRAMLRRRENYTPDLLDFEGLVLNRSTCEMSYGSKSQMLGLKEFQIMEMLMERSGMIVSVDRMMNHIWSWNSESDISVVWVHISNLRKKIAALGAPFDIKSMRGAGYMLGRRSGD